MLVMIMMGVGKMVEGITFDRYEEFVEVLSIRRFMSEEFGRRKWNHDTLAATMFTEEVYEIPERYRLGGVLMMFAPQFACLAWPIWKSFCVSHPQPITSVLIRAVFVMAHLGLL